MLWENARRYDGRSEGKCAMGHGPDAVGREIMELLRSAANVLGQNDKSVGRRDLPAKHTFANGVVVAGVELSIMQNENEPAGVPAQDGYGRKGPNGLERAD